MWALKTITFHSSNEKQRYKIYYRVCRAEREIPLIKSLLEFTLHILFIVSTQPGRPLLNHTRRNNHNHHRTFPCVWWPDASFDKTSVKEHSSCIFIHCVINHSDSLLLSVTGRRPSISVMHFSRPKQLSNRCLWFDMSK